MSIVYPATALWNQRHVIAGARDRILRLSAAVARPSDFSLSQWAQITAFILEFAPDTIIELGRGMGNSTCCFLEVANQLGAERPCRLLSLDLVDSWSQETVPKLQGIVPAEWFRSGEIVVGDILAYDFSPYLDSSKRCVIFWDAHGVEVADCVLGKLLPPLKNKPHLVLMHDVCDNRYPPMSPEYGPSSLWRGENATYDFFWLGHVVASVAQAISVLDFTARNQIPLHSAAESIYVEFSGDRERTDLLRELWGKDLSSLVTHWCWFTLNEAPGPITFPALPPERSDHPDWKAELGKSQQENQRLQAVIAELQTSLAEKSHELGQSRQANQTLQETIKLMQESITWRTAERWRKIKNRMAPAGSSRDALYRSARRWVLGK